ncbi:chorismate mutase [Methyloceanibacter superfactus]|nr:chorismate mutase [Methyloceanibacter superfactus]
MDEVRVEIDRIDQAMVDLICERFAYVDRAWQLKTRRPTRGCPGASSR